MVTVGVRAPQKIGAPFAINITCSSCAGPLGLVNAVAQGHGSLSVAILECPACQREWEVTARMVPAGPSRAGAERAAAAKRDAKARERARELVPA